MKTNEDELLSALLQYNTRLVEQPFVDDIVNKVEANRKRRWLAVVLMIFAASLISIPILLSVVKDFQAIGELKQLSPYLLTLCLLSIFGTFTWLISEDF